MARKNAYLERLERQKQAEMQASRLFVIQQCKDMMLIAANEAFGFGQDRIKKLSDTFDAVFERFANLVIEDAKDDAAIWYSKSIIDQRLKEICGEHFVEWDERYR